MRLVVPCTSCLVEVTTGYPLMVRIRETILVFPLDEVVELVFPFSSTNFSTSDNLIDFVQRIVSGFLFRFKTDWMVVARDVEDIFILCFLCRFARSQIQRFE